MTRDNANTVPPVLLDPIYRHGYRSYMLQIYESDAKPPPYRLL